MEYVQSKIAIVLKLCNNHSRLGKSCIRILEIGEDVAAGGEG